MKTATIITVFAVVAVLGGIYAWTEYSRSHVRTADVKPVIVVDAQELLADFQEDEDKATTHYVGASEQVIQVNGRIREIMDEVDGKVNVVLATSDALAGVVCEFEAGSIPEEWRVGNPVQLKGICTGMLMDVVLVRCVAVE